MRRWLIILVVAGLVGAGCGGDSGLDEVELDALRDACADGDGAACDDLFWGAPKGSEYEEFGASCGGRGPAPSCADAERDDAAAATRKTVPATTILAPPAEVEPVDCTEVDGPCEYGDAPELDALWDECAAGNNGLACDELRASAPVGTRYEQFGSTCGDRGEEASCEAVYGDGSSG